MATSMGSFFLPMDVPRSWALAAEFECGMGSEHCEKRPRHLSGWRNQGKPGRQEPALEREKGSPEGESWACIP